MCLFIRLLHPLVRTLDDAPELRMDVMNTICAMIVQLGKQFQVFVPVVHRAVREHRITHKRYEVLVPLVQKVCIL